MAEVTILGLGNLLWADEGVRYSGVVQARVSTLRQKSAGIVLMAGDTLTGNVRRLRVAVVRDVAHGQAAVIEDRDRRGFTEQRCAHGILLFMYTARQAAKKIIQQSG